MHRVGTKLANYCEDTESERSNEHIGLNPVSRLLSAASKQDPTISNVLTLQQTVRNGKFITANGYVRHNDDDTNNNHDHHIPADLHRPLPTRFELSDLKTNQTVFNDMLIEVRLLEKCMLLP